MIRSIMTTDIDALCKINSEELGYDYPREQSLTQLRKILNDSNHYLLALYGDETTKKILGYVHAEVYEEIYAEPTLNVLALAVVRDNQNSGIGTQLMSWLENTAVSKGYKSIRLNSGMSRKSAHEFYEHINYVHTKNQKKFIKKLK